MRLLARSQRSTRTRRRTWRRPAIGAGYLVVQNAVVLSQACSLWIEPEGSKRDRAMAENVKWILDTEGPDTRILLWAHNTHVSRVSDGSIEPMGSFLSAALGSNYVAIAQFFNRGSFRAWKMQQKDETRLSVMPIDIGPVPVGYMEAGLAAVGMSEWALDLRKAPGEGPVRQWLASPHPFRDLSAAFLDEEGSKSLLTLANSFDTIIFVEEVAATRANPTGLRGPESR